MGIPCRMSARNASQSSDRRYDPCWRQPSPSGVRRGEGCGCHHGDRPQDVTQFTSHPPSLGARLPVSVPQPMHSIRVHRSWGANDTARRVPGAVHQKYGVGPTHATGGCEFVHHGSTCRSTRKPVASDVGGQAPEPRVASRDATDSCAHRVPVRTNEVSGVRHADGYRVHLVPTVRGPLPRPERGSGTNRDTDTRRPPAHVGGPSGVLRHIRHRHGVQLVEQSPEAPSPVATLRRQSGARLTRRRVACHSRRPPTVARRGMRRGPTRSRDSVASMRGRLEGRCGY